MTMQTDTISFDELTAKQKAVMPNLFIIGAAKCGTTSLHAYLSAHPDITGSSQKEPSFFVDQKELERELLMESTRPESYDLDAYLALFDHGPTAKYRMEASPTYSSHPTYTGVAQRIAAASPDAHIIYMIRNPVERSISKYWQDRKTLRQTRPANEVLLEADNVYTHSSDYKMQLDIYKGLFKNIHVILAEDLRKEPQKVLNDIYHRLGLPKHVYNPEDLRERNTTPATTRVARHALVTRLRDTQTWNKVRARAPKPLLQLARKLTVKDLPRTIENEPEVRQVLIQRFAPKMAAFDAAYGTDLHDQWFAGVMQAAPEKNLDEPPAS